MRELNGVTIEPVHEQTEEVFYYCETLVPSNREGNTIWNVVRLLLFQEDEGSLTLSVDEFPNCFPSRVRDVFVPKLSNDRTARPEEAPILVVLERFDEHFREGR